MSADGATISATVHVTTTVMGGAEAEEASGADALTPSQAGEAQRAADEAKADYAKGDFESGDSKVKVLEDLFTATGGNMDLDALMREVFQKRRENAEANLLMQTNIVKGMNDQQTALNNEAGKFKKLGDGSEKPGDNIKVHQDSIDATSVGQFQERTGPDGQPVGTKSDWVAKLEDPNVTEVDVKKKDIDVIATEYADAATSMGNDIQSQMIKMTTASDRRNESAEMESKHENRLHEMHNKLIANM